MPLTNEESTDGIKTLVHVYDEEDPKNRWLAFEINPKAEVVRFFPSDQGYPVKEIVFEGYKRIPQILHENGYFRGSGVQYSLGRKLSEINVTKLTVVKSGDPKVRKYKSGHSMVLPEKELIDLIERFKAISAQARLERSLAASEVFNANFPKKYSIGEASDSVRFSRLMSNLDTAMVQAMSPEQVDKLLDFAAKVISEKYTSTVHRDKLFRAAKMKFDNVTLDDVISSYQSLLKKGASEADWGKFLQKNLFLVESRYVGIIPQLNLMLGGARKVDFGLVDTHGFLDLFEVKKPDTQLLAKSQDRGNWYWSTEAVKAITQAEKYLHNAERKGANLAEDIKREYRIETRVNKPRAVLIMGDRSQLTEESMITDFRVLCASLKNVEVVTYDDLLERLKNQKDKIYADQPGG